MGMSFKCLIIFLTVLLFKPVYAATFLPNHLSVIMNEVDGWVLGKVIDLTYKKNLKDQVVTVVTLSLKQFSGLQNSEIPNPNNFKLMFRGGKWDGVNYLWSGSPSLSSGTSYLFLLQKKRDGFYLSGLSEGVIGSGRFNQKKVEQIKAFSLKRFGSISEVGRNNIFISRNVKNGTEIGSRKPRVPASGGSIEIAPGSKDKVSQDFTTIIILLFFLLLIFLFLFLGKNENFKS